MCGPTPVALAIINGRTEILNEIFANINISRSVKFSQVVITETNQTLLHLLLLHCPSIDPRSVVEFLTKSEPNAEDLKGNTILMALAEKGSRCSLRRVLGTQVAEQCYFDYSIKNKDGKNILHFLMEDCDLISIKQVLNLLQDSSEVLNAMDNEQRSPLMIACHKGFKEITEFLQSHTKYSKMVDWNLKDESGKTITHLANDTLKSETEPIGTEIIYTKMSKRKKIKKIKKEKTMHIVTEKQKIQPKMSAPSKHQNMKQYHDENLPNKLDTFTDNLDEELNWIRQMKIEEEERQIKLDNQNQLTELVNVINSINIKMEEVENKEIINAAKKTNQNENAQKLDNIAKNLEKRRLRKLEAKTKITKEDSNVPAEEKALYEEIIWALTQEIEVAGQAGDVRAVDLLTRQLKEEEEKMDGTWKRRQEQKAKDKEKKEDMKRQEKERKSAMDNEERKRAHAKEIEEKLNQEKLAEEKSVADAIKKEIEKEKIEQERRQNKEQEKKQLEIEAEKRKKEEELTFERLPIWKKHNILKEKAMNKEIQEKKEHRMRLEEQWEQEERTLEEERIKEQERQRLAGHANFIKMQAELHRRALEEIQRTAEEERQRQEALQEAFQKEEAMRKAEGVIKKEKEVARKRVEEAARKEAEEKARQNAEWEARQKEYENKRQKLFEKQEAEERILTGAKAKEKLRAQEQDEARFIKSKKKILRDQKLACLTLTK